MPAAASTASSRSSGTSRLMPSADSASAAPDFEDSARLPCFATGTPQPATTSDGRGGDVEAAGGVAAGADDVDRPGRCLDRQHPRPHRADSAGRSGTVSPRTRIAISSPAICAGVASPAMMMPKAASASLSARRSPAASRARTGFSVFTPALRPGPWRATGSSATGHGHARLAMLSGWNCTPQIGRSRWARPMSTPSSVQAVASSPGAGSPGRRSGNDSGSRGTGRAGRRRHRCRGGARPRPCHAPDPGRERPSRRRPGRSPDGRGRPRAAAPRPAAAPISGRQMPASFGVQGPGESTIASGRSASASWLVSASLRRDLDLHSKVAQEVIEIEGKLS